MNKPGLAMLLVACTLCGTVSAATITRDVLPYDFPTSISTSTSFLSPGFGGSDMETAVQSWQHAPEKKEQTSVPVPAAAWLFLSGLVGMIGISRRKRNKH